MALIIKFNLAIMLIYIAHAFLIIVASKIYANIKYKTLYDLFILVYYILIVHIIFEINASYSIFYDLSLIHRCITVFLIPNLFLEYYLIKKQKQKQNTKKLMIFINSRTIDLETSNKNIINSYKMVKINKDIEYMWNYKFNKFI